MKNFVLASGSPRRRELIGRFIKDFTVLTDDSEEIVVQGERPCETVKRLALQKAENVAKLVDKPSVILAADTVVVIDDKILGKPKDEADAYKMLSGLSGNFHEVYTGIAVIDTENKKIFADYETTRVKFKELTDTEILAYIKSKEPMDKAGAYGIQEIGAMFIEGIEGDYFNVVGLPLCRLGKILKEDFNIDFLEDRRCR